MRALRSIRGLLLAVCCVVAAAGFAPVRVVHACGLYTCLPVLTGVTPVQVQLDGRPVHITLSGANLSAVTTVIVAPLVATQGWTVVDDSTVVVTLPANVAPGIYSVRAVSGEGSSDPSMAPQFQVFAAPPPTAPPAPKAVATPVPAPAHHVSATPGAAGAVALAVPAAAAQTPEAGPVKVADSGAGAPSPPDIAAAPVLTATASARPSPAAPVVDIMAGLALGAMLYILWGRPRRLAGTWRSEPLRHLIGRPAQALHLGNICLYCGRLHFVLFTRRDLWRAGKYCRPRCFISAEATATPPLVEEELLGVASAPRHAARTGGS